MKNLVINQTKKTPEINFDVESGKFLIKGRSIPENSIEYYSTLFDFVDEYKKTGPYNTEISIQLDYFNTSSSKCLLELLKRFEDIPGSVVKWYYEEDDEDMYDAGRDYDEILKVNFEITQYVID